MGGEVHEFFYNVYHFDLYGGSQPFRECLASIPEALWAKQCKDFYMEGVHSTDTKCSRTHKIRTLFKYAVRWNRMMDALMQRHWIDCNCKADWDFNQLDRRQSNLIQPPWIQVHCIMDWYFTDEDLDDLSRAMAGSNLTLRNHPVKPTPTHIGCLDQKFAC